MLSEDLFQFPEISLLSTGDKSALVELILKRCSLCIIFLMFQVSGSNKWERLDSSENGPEELEEHTMVEHQGILYIFGGMVDSAFTQKKNPFWLYDTDPAKWLQCQLTAVQGEGTTPTNRKGHSAVVYRGSMYMYGGYIDMKGVSQEFWTFCFDTKQWFPVPSTQYGGSPGPRHGHTAVVYGNGMYLFGGLMGLSEQKDFWKWDFVATNWSSIRNSQGPPKVVGHAALIFQDSMLVFGGGISNAKPNGTLWKYHFPSEMWEKVASPTDGNPSSKTYHCLLGLGHGFQEMTDSSCISLNHYLHRKGKHCSKLLAISKQHSCFCEYFQTEPAYQAFSSDDGNEIEMSTFHQPQKQPGFCSLQTTSNAELSANQPAGSLSKKEKISYLKLSREQDQATLDLPEEADFSCLDPDYGNIGDHSTVLLIIGGKPFSSSCAISFWQMELDKI
uniref:Uncharacterized protein n=1 Tax=Sphaerodactylus townsendi TaxID=933632 RepID=A0ACB8G1R4_9SAUR